MKINKKIALLLSIIGIGAAITVPTILLLPKNENTSITPEKPLPFKHNWASRNKNNRIQEYKITLNPKFIELSENQNLRNKQRVFEKENDFYGIFTYNSRHKIFMNNTINYFYGLDEYGFFISDWNLKDYFIPEIDIKYSPFLLEDENGKLSIEDSFYVVRQAFKRDEFFYTFIVDMNDGDTTFWNNQKITNQEALELPYGINSWIFNIWSYERDYRGKIYSQSDYNAKTSKLDEISFEIIDLGLLVDNDGFYTFDLPTNIAKFKDSKNNVLFFPDILTKYLNENVQIKLNYNDQKNIQNSLLLTYESEKVNKNHKFSHSTFADILFSSWSGDGVFRKNPSHKQLYMGDLKQNSYLDKWYYLTQDKAALTFKNDHLNANSTSDFWVKNEWNNIYPWNDQVFNFNFNSTNIFWEYEKPAAFFKSVDYYDFANDEKLKHDIALFVQQNDSNFLDKSVDEVYSFIFTQDNLEYRIIDAIEKDYSYIEKYFIEMKDWFLRGQKISTWYNTYYDFLNLSIRFFMNEILEEADWSMLFNRFSLSTTNHFICYIDFEYTKTLTKKYYFGIDTQAEKFNDRILFQYVPNNIIFPGFPKWEKNENNIWIRVE